LRFGGENEQNEAGKKVTSFSTSSLLLAFSISPCKKKNENKNRWLFVPAQTYVAKMLESLKEFPARQEPASFSIDRVMEKLKMGMPSS